MTPNDEREWDTLDYWLSLSDASARFLEETLSPSSRRLHDFWLSVTGQWKLAVILSILGFYDDQLYHEFKSQKGLSGVRPIV